MSLYSNRDEQESQAEIEQDNLSNASDFDESKPRMSQETNVDSAPKLILSGLQYDAKNDYYTSDFKTSMAYTSELPHLQRTSSDLVNAQRIIKKYPQSQRKESIKKLNKSK